jgi:hypothetical protein
MGTVDLLSLAKQGALSAKQKADLKKKLVAKKRELAAAMKSVDQGLTAVAGKSKAKKRKTARAKR